MKGTSVSDTLVRDLMPPMITRPTIALSTIATIIGENGVSIRAASIQASGKTRISTLRLTLDVHSREEMNKVIQALRNKSDILDVYRTTT